MTYNPLSLIISLIKKCIFQKQKVVMSDYKKKQNEKLSIKADQIIKSLPPFCRDYFIGRSRIIADNTKISYANQLKLFFEYLINNNRYFGNKGMKEITLEDISILTMSDIEEFLDSLTRPGKNRGKLSDASIEHYTATLSSFFRFMCSHRYLEYNPISALERKKKKNRGIVYLNDEERDRYLETVSTVNPGKSGNTSSKKTRDSIRNIAIVKLFLSTGIRISELVGLDLNDINWSEHSITVERKGGDLDPDVFFSDEAESALKAYIEIRDEYLPKKDETALFLSSKGGNRMSVRGIEYMIKKQTAQSDVSGKHITPHKLRSSFAMHRLNNNGHDVMDVKEALHHKRIQSTMSYVEATNRITKKNNRNL